MLSTQESSLENWIVVLRRFLAWLPSKALGEWGDVSQVGDDGDELRLPYG